MKSEPHRRPQPTGAERAKLVESYVRQAANLMALGLPRQALYAEAAQAGLDPMTIAAEATALFAADAAERAVRENAMTPKPAARSLGSIER